MSKRNLILLFSCWIIQSGLSAQVEDTLLHCGAHVRTREIFRQSPDLEEAFNIREAQLAHQDSIDWAHGYPGMQMKSAAPNYVIPVVFHIIHNNGSENISTTQILDEMRILNNDYARRNSDTNLVNPPFKSRIADVGIEFRLAQIDPFGNPTSGIDRIVSPLTVLATDSSKLNPWPRNKYLNIWVVKSILGGFAGYAYLPGTSYPQYDGVLILSTYIGSIGTGHPITSRALTHEIGHFFNLLHPWGATNSPGVSCGDDGVWDTPYTKGWSTCPSPTGSEVCNTGVEENYQNFMDYSYCSKMFTTGQGMRMINALNSPIGQRNVLWTNANLTATGTVNSQGAGIFEEDNSPGIFTIFPNPASGEFRLHVRLNQSSKVGVSLSDLSGRELFHVTEMEYAGGEQEIKLVPEIQLPDGLYFVTLEADGLRSSRKLAWRNP